MTKITGVSIIYNGLGTVLNGTYSVIDESGNVTGDNKRVSTIVVDPEIQAHVDALTTLLQGKIE